MVSELFQFNIHVFYIFISALVTGILVLGDWSRPKVARIHAVVSAWSGLVYFNFLFSVFSLGLTPYVDWIVSTPLIVLAFGFSVKKEFDQEILLAMISQVLTIVFGLFAFLNDSALWFILSSFSMVGMLFYLYRITFEERPMLFTLLAISWIGYPLIYIYTGGNVVEATVPLVLLPLISKHVFSLIHVYTED